jgi:hypothetical protein
MKMLINNTMNNRPTLRSRINKTAALLTASIAVCLSAQAQNHFPTSGNVGIGITAPIYPLDIRSTTSNNLHVSGTGNDDGGYFGANFNGGFWVANSMFNGTNWVAKANTSAIMDTYLGDFLFYSNTGLTVGSTFTPTTLMKLTNTGRLGIGTTAPGSTLDVAGNINSSTGFTIGNTAPAAGTYLRSNGTNFVSSTIQPGDLPAILFASPNGIVGLTTINGVATTGMRSDAAPALSQAIAPTWTGTHIFSNPTNSALFTGGNVGIGTTSPQQALDVNGNVNIGGTLIIHSILAADLTTDPLIFQTNNIPRMTIALAGNVGIGTSTPAQALDIAGGLNVSQIASIGGNVTVGGTATISGAANLGGTLTLPGTITSTASSPIFLQTGGTTQMTITPSGNIGIGTSAPAQVLDVVGNTHVSGDQIIDGNTTVGGALNITGAFNTAGDITASCIGTACLNVSGTFGTDYITVNNSIVTDTAFTTRIASPDGIIRFGYNTLDIDMNKGNIYNDGNPNFISTGYVHGFPVSLLPPPNGVAIGQYATALSNNSICFGGGFFTGGSTTNVPLSNSTPNSLMVGFNSFDGATPALFVGPGDAIQNAGNVGIGTINPNATLQVNGSTSIYALSPNGSFNGNASLLFGQETATRGAGKWGIQYSQSGSNQQSGLKFWVTFD